MDALVDLFTNRLLLVPLICWIISQLIKVVINVIVEKQFSSERLFGDGGMPSGHSATVTGLMSVAGWCYGFDSIIFAICFILAVIVMHDAMGVRRETGKQAATIKQLADALNGLITERDEQVRVEKLKELVGHTPLQVFFGLLLGVLVSVIFFAIAGIGYKEMLPIIIA